MAMSYAFEGNCDGAAKYETPLYESYVAGNDFFNAGEIANELARVCLESGSLDQAAAWYRRGYDAGPREPNLKPERRDLWEFRWEHAQARLAARRGQAAEAQKHVAAAKAIFDRGTNPEQAPFVPYLVGYVAFYAGNHQAALAEFQKGNQNDPFILGLDRPVPREAGRQGEGDGVLPEGAGVERAQPDQRVRPAAGEGQAWGEVARFIHHAPGRRPGAQPEVTDGACRQVRGRVGPLTATRREERQLEGRGRQDQDVGDHRVSARRQPHLGQDQGAPRLGERGAGRHQGRADRHLRRCTK